MDTPYDTTTARADLMSLDTDLRTHAWVPSTMERTAASVVLASVSAGRSLREWVDGVLRAAGADLRGPGRTRLRQVLIEAVGTEPDEDVLAVLRRVHRSPLDRFETTVSAEELVLRARHVGMRERWTEADGRAVAACGLTQGELLPSPRTTSDFTGYARAEQLLDAVGKLRAVVPLAAPDGQLPLLCTIVADLCEDLRPDIDTALRRRTLGGLSNEVFRPVEGTYRLLAQTTGVLRAVPGAS
jgi:hypothetical protein